MSAGGRGVNLPETVKYYIHHMGWNADARISHRNQQPALLRLNRQGYTTLFREFDGVGHQINQNFGDSIFVNLNDVRQGGMEVCCEEQAFLFGQDTHVALKFGSDFLERNGPSNNIQPPRLHAADVEDVVNQ